MNDNFLMLGTSQGHIIFVRLDISDYIYGRFLVHRQEVVQLAQLREKQVFLSFCTELLLHLWGFVDGKLVKFQTIEMPKLLSHIETINDRVLMIPQQGDHR